jgi:hypothetical protein
MHASLYDHALMHSDIACLLLIYVDGTFLTGKYKGQILIAIGVNENHQLPPLAFAFMEGEGTYSWY